MPLMTTEIDHLRATELQGISKILDGNAIINEMASQESLLKWQTLSPVQKAWVLSKLYAQPSLETVEKSKRLDFYPSKLLILLAADSKKQRICPFSTVS